MMHSSDATASPAVEQIWRAGLLEALARAPRAATEDPVTSSLSATRLETAGRLPDDTADIRKWTWWSIPGGAEGTRVYRDDRSIAAERVLAATEPDEIVAALSLGGCRAAADRIRNLYEMTRDAAPDEPAIVLASLRELALFLLSQRRLVEPEIGLSPDGLLLAEWVSAERGVLAMKFLPDGIIQFAGVSAAGGAGPRLRVNGGLPKDRALDAVRAFVPSMNGPDAPRAAA